jgi:hypothetical protein
VGAVLKRIAQALTRLMVVVIMRIFNFIMQAVLGVYDEKEEKKNRRCKN